MFNLLLDLQHFDQPAQNLLLFPQNPQNPFPLKTQNLFYLQINFPVCKLTLLFFIILLINNLANILTHAQILHHFFCLFSSQIQVLFSQSTYTNFLHNFGCPSTKIKSNFIQNFLPKLQILILMEVGTFLGFCFGSFQNWNFYHWCQGLRVPGDNCLSSLIGGNP